MCLDSLFFCFPISDVYSNVTHRMISCLSPSVLSHILFFCFSIYDVYSNVTHQMISYVFPYILSQIRLIHM
jgi:hypothetical protein